MADDLIPSPLSLEPDEAREKVATARANARKKLPCPSCGNTDEPQIRKPRRLSPDWWMDPEPYFACAGCGGFLDFLPSTYPVFFGSEVPSDRDEDPGGFIAEATECIARALEPILASGRTPSDADVAGAIPGRDRGRAYAERIGVPGWDPPPEPAAFVGVGQALSPYFAVEAIGGDGSEVGRCLRSMAKLIWVRTVPSIESVFLVLALPDAAWKGDGPLVSLLEPGTHSLREAIRRHRPAWEKAIDAGEGTPGRLPDEIELEDIGTCWTRPGESEQWRVRAIGLTPCPEEAERW